MASALVSASTGVMESLLGKLSTMLEREYGKNKRIEKDLFFLRNELSSMNAVMQKYAMQNDPNLQVKAWIKEVRELAYDIEDTIDDSMAQVEEKSDEPTGIKGFVMDNIRKLKELFSRYNIAEEIEELKNQVLEVSDRRKRYKIDDSMSIATDVAIDPRLPALYAEVGGLVGIDCKRAKIIKLLTDEKEDGGFSQQLKLVSIVGFGGLGKTTLANQAYEKIKGQFDCAAFVFVSQRPNMKRILLDLLSELGTAGNMWDSERKLINKVREFLQDKRYLIVIDDIWSISTWEVLKCVLPENNLCSRIITTTRIFDVATTCCSSFEGHIYRIKPLSDEDSRSLFSKRVFHGEHNYPSHLEELSVEILRKCSGLPLAILHIAGLLATKSKTKDEWELVLNSIGSTLDNSDILQGMRKILLLSYYDLPHNLKTCLLYLSIYPEDYKIRTKTLLRKWISEGFIAEERGKRLDQVAQSYFNDLINRSMILPVNTAYDGNVHYCKVHDMVLNILISMSTEDNFVTIIDGHKPRSLPKRIRRLSLQCNNSEDALLATITKQSSVRSLSIFGYAKKVPSIVNFQALRVLDLDYCNWLKNHHIESIGSMLQLRYVVLRSKFISELPEQIGNLQHLEILDVRICSIQALPEAIVRLRKLACLNVSVIAKLPEMIGNMQCLKELSHVFISSKSIRLVQELSWLPELREFALTVEEPVEMGSYGSRFREALICSLCELGRKNLRALSLGYKGDESFILDSLMVACASLKHLQKFTIRKPVSRVPEWIGTFSTLQHLELDISRMAETDIDILKEISSLLYLRLVLTGHAPNGRVVIGSQGFQYLLEFNLMCFISGMWLVFAPGAMQKLQRYHLTFKLPESMQSGLEPMFIPTNLQLKLEYGHRIKRRRTRKGLMSWKVLRITI
ncbi:unnamed protein product [Alopecurus aequalis]